jgi:predicted secreted protein
MMMMMMKTEMEIKMTQVLLWTEKAFEIIMLTFYMIVHFLKGFDLIFIEVKFK